METSTQEKENSTEKSEFIECVQYVVGFLIHKSEELVMLNTVAQGKPHAGKWNGIGGKMKPTDKTVEVAQAREFFEKTGLPVPASSWIRFFSLERPADISLDGKPHQIHFLYTFINDNPHAYADSANQLRAYGVDKIFNIFDIRTLHNKDNVVRDILWLLPMVMARKDHRYIAKAIAEPDFDSPMVVTYGGYKTSITKAYTEGAKAGPDIEKEVFDSMMPGYGNEILKHLPPEWRLIVVDKQDNG